MSFSIISLFYLLLSIVTGVLARYGVDLSVETSSETWECFVKSNIDFAIIRAYRNNGQVDTNAIASLALASKAGFKDLGAYIFPCITSSAYSQSKGITCASADQQIADMMASLSSVSSLLNHVWIDIEDESPPKYFSSDVATNQAFVQALVDALNARNIPIGIYSTKTYWQNIMGNVLGYSQYPLWYPRYDGAADMDCFNSTLPFAGWTSVSIKQYSGDAALCELSQVDLDFRE